MKYKTFLMCAALLLITLPAYALTLQTETTQKALMKDWLTQWEAEIKFKAAKQRIARRCLAYYRPNEAAWNAHIAQTFGDRAIPIVLWNVWREHEALFLDDELPYYKYPEFKSLREKLKALGGYPGVGRLKNYWNLKWLREQIAMFEILNPLWKIYEDLSGEEPKISAKFDIQKMLKAIKRLTSRLALAKSVKSDDGSTTTSDNDIS